MQLHALHLVLGREKRHSVPGRLANTTTLLRICQHAQSRDDTQRQETLRHTVHRQETQTQSGRYNTVAVGLLVLFLWGAST